MKTIKKLFSLFIVFCLALSTAPVSVFADETGADSGREINYVEASSAAEAAAETESVKANEEDPVAESEEALAGDSGEVPAQKPDDISFEEALAGESDEISDTVLTAGTGEEDPENTDTLSGEALSDDETPATDNEALLGDSPGVNAMFIERRLEDGKMYNAFVTIYGIEPVPSDGNMTGGWYYLNSNVTKDGRIDSIIDNVNLILGDGFTLDVKGLYVPEGRTLKIFSQSDGDDAGRIYSHPGKAQGGAGIGGYSGHNSGNIVIHGGKIEADGYDHCAGIGSNDGRTGGDIKIYGGKVTANGGSQGAGIGGGRNCDGGNIEIYGGTVNAKGGDSDGAAIGGGDSGNGGTITIYGGTVNANDSDCNENGAAIGGGDCGDGGDITINGGTITTYSRDGAGIGGGDDGDGGTITINGGTITAKKVNQGQGARIGGGCDGDGGTVIINGGMITAEAGKGAGIGGGKGCKGGTVIIRGGVISSSGDYGIGKGEEGSDVSVNLGYTDATKDTISITASSYNGKVTLDQPFARYIGSDGQTLANVIRAGVVLDNAVLTDSVLKPCEIMTGNLEYTEYSWNEESRSLESTTVTPEDYQVLTSDMEELTSGTYAVSEDTTIDHYISVQKGATANLIVGEGVVLTCTEGIGCGYNKNGKYAALNIFGKGMIVVTGKENAAGIGGDDNETNGNIAIHGTTVLATGGTHGAGIGGGEGGKDPDGETSIKIYAGIILATGGVDGAGIGGGDGQPGAHTYIYSGTITADSKKHGAGIGGGDEEGALGIFIYGGKVTATGGGHGAGIGAGEHGGNLRKDKDGGGVNIYGGDVTATGGSGAAGIGCGYDTEMGGTVNISGNDTRLTVTGGSNGAGIGAGSGDWGANGDMNGTVTIDCGSESDIKITGGSGGAGIGAGYEGNFDGKCYYKNGNVVIYAGKNAAGIGGGSENAAGIGGEGGPTYIGGGNLKIFLNSEHQNDTGTSAIGNGGEDLVDGSLYIAANENGTGKYLRVDYSRNKTTWETAKASDRDDKCKVYNHITVTECDHKDCDGKSGLTYKIKGNKHIKECKYCGLEVTEEHTGSHCECGYLSVYTVELRDVSGLIAFEVGKGMDFELPDYGGEAVIGNENPPKYYRVKGWKDSSGRDYEPGETVTVNEDMSFVSVTEDLYQITFDDVPHGSIRANFSDGKTYAAAGETIPFSVAADPGYSVSKVAYKLMQGYETGSNGDAIYSYSDPVQISPVNGEYQLTMPKMTSVDDVDNNMITIKAEVTEDSVHTVFIPEDLAGGTVTADQTTAEEGTMVTLTVTSDSNYHLESIRCRKAGGEDVELTQVGETNQYTFVMSAEDVWVTAEWETASAVFIKGVTGSFNDKIKLNYYLDIPEEVMADENAYVTISNESTGKDVALPVKDAPFNKEKGGYKFSIPLAAKEASDIITAKVFGGEDSAITLIGERSGKDYTGTGVQYTLMRYFDWLETNGSDDNEKAVGATAKDYCASAQIYFKYNADGLNVSSAVDEVTADTLSSYIAVRDGELPEGVSIDGISAMLESDNTLRLYFNFNNVNPDDLSFTIDGNNAVLKQRSDGMYYLALDEGVYSNRLQDMHTYSVSDGADTYTITASVLTFARSCVIKKKGTEAEKNIGKALYLYNRAAVAAFGK